MKSGVVPTVGRIVHWYPAERETGRLGVGPLAAIITAVWDGGVGLTVFAWGSVEFRESVPYAIEPEPGHWSWPRLQG